MGRGVPVRRMFHGRMSVVHDLVSNFRLGQLEDHHRTAKDQGQEAESQRLPRLQGDQSESEGHQGGRFELEAKQERYHDFLDETTTCASTREN